MKFEELAGIWNSSDTELEKSVKINRELVKEVGLSKVKSNLYEIKWTGIFGVVVGILFFNFLMGFMVEHFSAPEFFFPALMLWSITVYSLILEIYKLSLLYTLDARVSVMEARKKLMRLQRLEIMDIYSLYIIIPLFSAPFLIVIAKAFLDMSLYTFGLTWLIQFTLGSVVVAVILVFFLRKYPSKNLRASIAFLDELKENKA
ncbi:hypothetical protein [Catalinimonas niigatensis]|uniref:hypothetical protein n=1 Tax=Catalinimonas niigatensis TaxID=1397264 RepID=UPI00266509FE|nr:hypothetical protein [Catalinimonas niigatensis]WPP49065.1 hypothetical protein PZB72_20570 [Catalinimonas niigatensis]